jgi:hypothetical protein
MPSRPGFIMYEIDEERLKNYLYIERMYQKNNKNRVVLQ